MIGPIGSASPGRALTIMVEAVTLREAHWPAPGRTLFPEVVSARARDT